ncbi:odorant receptor 4-like [Phlebotomus papatasi]|nr:odorant receptor 4-like [Phlebotomus papatasi]
MYFFFEDFSSSMVPGTFILVAMITQVFILCFFSQLLENSSESIFQALYLTKWYDMDLKDQKNILLLMIIFKNSIKIDTFGFGAISIYTFVQICKAAGSYAMVMYTVFN